MGEGPLWTPGKDAPVYDRGGRLDHMAKRVTDDELEQLAIQAGAGALVTAPAELVARLIAELQELRDVADDREMLRRELQEAKEQIAELRAEIEVRKALPGVDHVRIAKGEPEIP